jgi:hypothetical protein
LVGGTPGKGPGKGRDVCAAAGCETPLAVRADAEPRPHTPVQPGISSPAVVAA